MIILGLVCAVLCLAVALAIEFGIAWVVTWCMVGIGTLIGLPIAFSWKLVFIVWVVCNIIGLLKRAFK